MDHGGCQSHLITGVMKSVFVKNKTEKYIAEISTETLCYMCGLCGAHCVIMNALV